ncbi:inner centromere protein containing ARK binding region [Nitzschia inconspicua]|uniref:Inner centromere protein containing ARK binding region n=1 Tax=Nitzschia inconspicua TaxID=303405 RepID=A0A9K3PI53_9STRA|nr:inner centromere protein containing ARK binding region [Nitzschia inconspicua]
MSTRTLKVPSNHFQTLVSVIDQARAPFQPRCLPNQKLADEIESCKRKIWECIGSVERQRHLEKKQKTQREIVVENKENTTVEIPNSMTSAKKFDVSPTKPTQQQQSASAHLPKISLSSRSTIEFKVNAMKVAELRKELIDRGYNTGGLKKDLRARLLDAMLVELEAEGSIDIPIASMHSKPTQANTDFGAYNEDSTESSENKDGIDTDVMVKSIVEKKMSIETTNPGSTKKMSIEKSQIQSTKKMSIEPQQQQETTAEQENYRGSISSMQVEHHSTTDKQPSFKIEEEKATKSAGKVASSKSYIGSPAVLRSPTTSIQVKLQAPQSSAKKVSTDSSANAFKGVPDTTREATSGKKHDQIPSAVKIGKPSVCSNVSSDGSARPPSEASSSISKGSGKMVRDMISKFSGQTSLSSSVGGPSSSAVSQEMKKIQGSRMAKIAEMREKSKTNTATKLGMTPKEPQSLQKSFVVKGSLASASAKKDKLAAQMREKAAAAAQTQKKAFVGSTSKLTAASSNKGHIHFSGGVQDSLGATLKQPVTNPVVKPKVQSPMDTYEISDREGSDSDDSDSEAENDQQKKRIPTWAIRQNLIQALEEQYHGKVDGKRVDPDDIFPEVQSCDLVAIFGNKKADKYRSRNSSGNWMRDKVTAAEKLVYKRDMGFATHHEREESEI